MSRWIAAAGAFVVSLDSTVNIAFPALAAAFAVPPERMRWVIVCYVLTYAVTSFAGGALGDRVGHARVFQAGAVLTGAGLLLGGLAPSLAWLLAARVVQGFGSGLVYGTAPGLVTLGVAPAARGRALGFLNAAIGLGFAVGPLAAGAMLEALGWRSIFLARVVPAVVTVAWALRAAPARRAPAAARLVAARDVFRAPVLGPGALAFVANAGIFAVWLLAPFYLVVARGLPEHLAGVLFTCTPLGTVVAAPLAGRLADRIGPRAPMATGLAVESAGLLVMAAADATTAPALIAAALFAAGFGLGLFTVPNMALVMTAFPATQQGAAGGFSFSARTLGIVVGVLVLAETFARRRLELGLGPAVAEAFGGASGAVALAALVALVATLRCRPRPPGGPLP